MFRKNAQDFVRSGANEVTDEDVDKVVNKSEEIEDKFEARGPLGRFIEDGRLLISFVKDYRDGKYRRIPYWIIGAAVFALLYVFNPLDIIPDFLPFLGVVDDATVMGAALVAIERDLGKYKDWKLSHPASSQASQS